MGFSLIAVMEHEECAEGPHYVTEKLKNLEVDGSVVRHNPNDHYAEELPEREVRFEKHSFFAFLESNFFFFFLRLFQPNGSSKRKAFECI